MARTLSISRVRVAPEREGEYLATLASLAALLVPRGQHLWIFRSTGDPQLFLEFSESPTPMSHRHLASRTPEELRLEQRLHRVAQYQGNEEPLWQEVPLTAGHSPES